MLFATLPGNGKRRNHPLIEHFLYDEVDESTHGPGQLSPAKVDGIETDAQIELGQYPLQSTRVDLRDGHRCRHQSNTESGESGIEIGRAHV